MDDNALDIILRLQDELSPALAKAQQTIRDAAKDASGVGVSGAKDVKAANVDLLGTLGEVAAAFGVAYSLASAVNLIKTVGEEEHALHVLGLQTQMNVEDLQVLSNATREYGVDGDQLGRALFQLGRRIAGDDASVATAYHMMGMSIDEVKGKDPLDLFLTTERGLGKLQGTLRDTASADLYGGKLGVSLGAFSTGVDEAMDKSRRLNVITSKESVDAANDYAEAVDRATHSLHAMVGELEGKIAVGLETINAANQKGASWWQLSAAAAADWVATQTTGKPVVSAMAALLDDVNQKTAQNTQATVSSTVANDAATTAVLARRAAFDFMVKTQLDSAKPLLDYQQQDLDQLEQMGDLNAKNAAAIGVTIDQYNKYIAAKKASAEADKIGAEMQAELVKATDDYFKAVDASSHDSVSRQINDVYLTASTRIAALEKTKAYSIEAEMMIWKAAEQTANNIIQKTLESDPYTREHYALIADQARIAYEFALTHASSFTAQETQLLHDAYTTAEQNSMHWAAQAGADMDKVAGKAKPAASTIKLMGAAADAAAMAIQSAPDTHWIEDLTAQVHTLSGEWISAADAKKQFDMGNTLDVATAAQDPRIMALLKEGWSLKNAEALKLAQDWGFTPQLFDPLGNPETTPSPGERVPGYAAGVMNARPGWAMVGERGPELMYVPPGANIYSNGGDGGGAAQYHTHVYVTNPLGTPTAIANAVSEALMARERNTGVRY